MTDGWDAGAEIVDCYRYRLWRIWDKNLPLLCWVMLNPSTADAFEDDPTIEKCMAYARSWGFGGIKVVNLFAYRATDPKNMIEASQRGVDVVGPMNDSMILQTIQECSKTVFAWGTHGELAGRGKYVVGLVSPLTETCCLGLNTGGTPKHPLYLRGSLKPVPMGG